MKEGPCQEDRSREAADRQQDSDAVAMEKGSGGMKIYFAPMEGITDGILRRAHQEIFGGVEIYGLPFHKLTQSVTLTTREKRDIDPAENQGIRVLPQALTRDPDQLLRWLELVAALGYDCADLNIGCPSPTVTKRGRGSGMLRDPEGLQTFLDQVFARPLPVELSVKTRIGYERAEEWPVLLDVLGDYPFAHVTIHVRTMREQYTGGIHPEAFGEALRKGIPHPVYNGDLRTVSQVEAFQNRFPEAAGVMIGRGLLSDPSLARQLRGGEKAGKEELRAWYTRLYEEWKNRFHSTLALGRIKKLMTWPAEGDLRKNRLLRRADSLEGCIHALLDS